MTRVFAAVATTAALGACVATGPQFPYDHSRWASGTPGRTYHADRGDGTGFFFTVPDGIYRISGGFEAASIFYRPNAVSQANVDEAARDVCRTNGTQPSGGRTVPATGLAHPSGARAYKFSCR